MNRRRLTLFVCPCLLAACAGPKENRDPTLERFPAVEATSLAGDTVAVPEAFAGEAAVLLVGYVQNTQFDIDRWILGLLQAETPVALYELPTIEGIIPGMISGTIEEGMRNGIPKEDWGAVLTVYDDAEKITTATGTVNPNNARVFLLDARGGIVWFHDRGYSAAKVLELDAAARALESSPR